MRFRSYLLIILAAFALSPALAQVDITFNSGGWGYRPGVTVSVGQGNRGCGPVYRRQRVYRRRNRHYNRGGGYYYNQNQAYYPVQNSGAYWCGSHNMYCTHGYSQPVYQDCGQQPYWCGSHNMYCTH